MAREDSAARAASWSGRLIRSDLEVNWELAGRRPRTGAAGLAAVSGLVWRPLAALRLELQSGVAGAVWPEAAAVLPSGALQGWAVRLQWRDRGHGALQLLLQGARQWPRATSPRRRALQVAELAWERRSGPGVTVSIRARHAARRETTWSERAPWEPGDEAAAAMRTLVAADVDWEGPGTSLTGRWRSFTVAGGTGGTRQIISLGGRHHLSQNINLWTEVAAAWGDPVDLVTALAPLPGLVVARHWGHWRSEAAGGVAAAWGPLALRAAVARRLPDRTHETGPDAPAGTIEGWVEVSGSW